MAVRQREMKLSSSLGEHLLNALNDIAVAFGECFTKEANNLFAYVEMLDKDPAMVAKFLRDWASNISDQ